VYSQVVPRAVVWLLCSSLAFPFACLAACAVRIETERPAPASCRRPDLVVVTYNVRFDTRRDHEHRWSRRRAQVGGLVRQLGPDLVGMQEVKAEQLDDLVPMLPGYSHEGVGRDDGARGGEFSPIFYSDRRFVREDGGTFWLSPTPERPRGRWELKPWGSWHNRIATWVHLRDRVGDDSYLVVNTHFDRTSELARRQSARLLVKFLRQRTADHFIVMGDLNSRPGSEPVRILSTVLRNTMSAPWVKEPPSRTSVTTWSGLGDPGEHIDHIFTSRDLHPLTYEVVDRRLVYSGGQYYPSDHLPVRAGLCVEHRAHTPHRRRAAR
jgi:endonuclease/exonuclease/phosphatase family metal-dependent hydrolase